MEVYLIISDNGERTKITGVFAAKDKLTSYYEFLDNNHPDRYIREKQGDFNIKYYDLIDDIKVFKEHMYIEKRQVIE